ncbi:uncharacterized protein Tco025E_02092 [Trypanosoma conorhini]|uniref:Uncharacterized protein n=1 Tax=Trypanosoma conorhini TaxID=83891 RepID=A0A3R7PHZ8_9TRYP|nr:uncharacterized protein Tco025E_02092 [Trypanosoma conorhini]RNF25596.1 hypothetical protein Tco025E_02092 [Trypanosoma conorhini]
MRVGGRLSGDRCACMQAGVKRVKETKERQEALPAALFRFCSIAIFPISPPPPLRPRQPHSLQLLRSQWTPCDAQQRGAARRVILARQSHSVKWGRTVTDARGKDEQQ